MESYDNVCVDTIISLLVTFSLFKQKTAYKMRISDWSSDVCSSDLGAVGGREQPAVFNTHADVAAAAGGQAALMQGGAKPADGLALARFVAHGRKLHALVKKSVLPKLPDFRAR